MKDLVSLLIVMAAYVIPFCIAGWVAVSGVTGWGWFLAGALLSATGVKYKGRSDDDVR